VRTGITLGARRSAFGSCHTTHAQEPVVASGICFLDASLKSSTTRRAGLTPARLMLLSSSPPSIERATQRKGTDLSTSTVLRRSNETNSRPAPTSLRRLRHTSFDHQRGTCESFAKTETPRTTGPSHIRGRVTPLWQAGIDGLELVNV
jgi:hypothetical protein